MIQSLNFLILWTFWKCEAICHRLYFYHLQYTPIPNHTLWFTWCYQSFFLSLLWKLGRCSSWLINLKLCSKRRSFFLLPYFYSCFIFLGRLLSPSSVYCKLSFILFFTSPSFLFSEIADHRNLFLSFLWCLFFGGGGASGTKLALTLPSFFAQTICLLHRQPSIFMLSLGLTL